MNWRKIWDLISTHPLWSVVAFALASTVFSWFVPTSREWWLADSYLPRIVFAGLVAVAVVFGASAKFLLVFRKLKSRAIEEARAEVNAIPPPDAASAEAMKQIEDRFNPPAPTIPTEFKPTDNQRRALVYLLEHYDVGSDLAELHNYTRCINPAATAQELEKLVDANVLVGKGHHQDYFGLTRIGRDAAQKWCEGMKSNVRPNPRGRI